METLEITKESAIKAHDSSDEKGKELLENLFGKKIFSKDIRDRINSIQDIFFLNGTTEEEFNKKWEGKEPYEKAHSLELLIVNAYNDGNIADWTDGKPKFIPWFNMPNPSGAGFSFSDFDRWNAYSLVGSRQVFCGPNAKENLLDAVDKFLPEYKDSRTL